ncbi:MAG: TonB-dependent receptor plug domain-containing protein, partial [Opitutae bacterium]|nr:TonB-dependent receptor plug domain-containing protein [Opitutae bacterium]
MARKPALLCIGLMTCGGLTLLGQEEDDENVVTLETFEIYGDSAAASVAKQRNSDIIGSYLSSDALSELLDDDLGEALSRLAGINVIGGQGNSEAIVTIRGAAGQYNTIRINGAAPSNARVGDLGGSNRQNFISREFDLNQIPAEMVSGVEV